MDISSRLSDWPKEQPSVTVTFDMPDTLQGLVDKFGETVVAAKAIDSITIDVQAVVRRQLRAKDEKDRTVEAIQAKVSAYKPSSNTAVRRSPVEKVGDLVSKMTPEEKKALIKQLREAA